MIRKLSDEQVAPFDTVHIPPELRPAWDRCLAQRFAPDAEFRVVDVGGGNGVLADALLEAYPRARATVVDNSELLLNRNRPDERKSLLMASAEEIDTVLEDRSVDLICFHWVLHHFVSGGYRETTRMVRSILDTARRKLRPGGRLSVFENMYDGALVDDLPGRVIYSLTSSRALRAPIRRLGANTAGVGVCFRSRRAWSRLLSGCGYRTLAYDAAPTWGHFGLLKRTLLGIRSVGEGHFWLGDAAEASGSESTAAA